LKYFAWAAIILCINLDGSWHSKYSKNIVAIFWNAIFWIALYSNLAILGCNILTAPRSRLCNIGLNNLPMAPQYSKQYLADLQRLQRCLAIFQVIFSSKIILNNAWLVVSWFNGLETFEQKLKY
jgi:hypothetical protein